jgi:CubicO group peptidase (beta-lactamase class C family)
MIPTVFSRLRGVIACLLLVITNYGYTQNTKQLDSLFEGLNRQSALNGCILIAENGKPIYEKAFGYADFNLKRLLNNQSVFELASVSKQFTAMAIMQLHQQKKLNYDDNIKKYLPSIPYQNITINNLLHHTSGIPEFLQWSKNEIDINRINYNKDVLNAIVKNNLRADFKPGERLSYSNTNYVLLALIVEQVSGMPFSDYMRKYIFDPLNMTDTHVYAQRATDKKLKNYAYGHIYDPKRSAFISNDSITANRYQYYFDGVAGPYGISSSTEDLLKWDQGLYTDKLISKEEQKSAYLPSTLSNGKPATLMGLPYGYGWLMLPASNTTGTRYMHSGGYPGYMTIITRYPDKNKTIIILTNTYNVINLYQLCAAAENILFGKPFTIPAVMPFKKSVILTPSQLHAITGVYAFKSAPQVKFTISIEDNQAYAQLSGQGKAEIYPDSELEFFYTVVNAQIKFERNQNGVINKVTLLQNGQQMEATRE